MDLSGILNVFDELPPYQELLAALAGETAVTPCFYLPMPAPLCWRSCSAPGGRPFCC
ncbi:MAG: hypothetical protein M5U34_02640 [Chloroflexi bacterium]|nr:hypothetical protein [Chloroflexota bacterium]